jgi:hypothetical protein
MSRITHTLLDANLLLASVEELFPDIIRDALVLARSGRGSMETIPLIALPLGRTNKRVLPLGVKVDPDAPEEGDVETVKAEKLADAKQLKEADIVNPKIDIFNGNGKLVLGSCLISVALILTAIAVSILGRPTAPSPPPPPFPPSPTPPPTDPALIFSPSPPSTSPASPASTPSCPVWSVSPSTETHACELGGTACSMGQYDGYMVAAPPGTLLIGSGSTTACSLV